MEDLARCIIRASFSQKRMTNVPEAGSVLYQSKGGKTWFSMCGYSGATSGRVISIMVRYAGPLTPPKTSDALCDEVGHSLDTLDGAPLGPCTVMKVSLFIPLPRKMSPCRSSP